MIFRKKKKSFSVVNKGKKQNYIYINGYIKTEEQTFWPI